MQQYKLVSFYIDKRSFCVRLFCFLLLLTGYMLGHTHYFAWKGIKISGRAGAAFARDGADVKRSRNSQLFVQSAGNHAWAGESCQAEGNL